jgi:hypothetical protein
MKRYGAVEAELHHIVHLHQLEVILQLPPPNPLNSGLRNRYCEKGNLRPHRDSNSGSSSPLQVAVPTSVAKKLQTNKKKNPGPLVRKRTMPTERPPLVGEILCQLLWIEGFAFSARRIPHGH